jgi:hypothetical protein
VGGTWSCLYYNLTQLPKYTTKETADCSCPELQGWGISKLCPPGNTSKSISKSRESCVHPKTSGYYKYTNSTYPLITKLAED